ncbi:Uncharacterised protein [Bordetella pertussis]|nr:Uncharacterised protein [Bordetella pertussis]
MRAWLSTQIPPLSSSGRPACRASVTSGARPILTTIRSAFTCVPSARVMA